MEPLDRIKRLLARGLYRFSRKALDELDADGLDPEDAPESVWSAVRIRKTIVSRSARRTQAREKLYVIEGHNRRGTLVYTKGRIAQEGDGEVHYFFISAKISRTNA